MRENSVGGIVLFLKNAHTSEDDLNQTEFANLTRFTGNQIKKNIL